MACMQGSLVGSNLDLSDPDVTWHENRCLSVVAMVARTGASSTRVEVPDLEHALVEVSTLTPNPLTLTGVPRS